jgi:hypothetical protein
MSYYENTKRWLQSGVNSKNEARALAPGFGRNREKNEPHTSDGERGDGVDEGEKIYVGGSHSGNAKSDVRLAQSATPPVKAEASNQETAVVDVSNKKVKPSKALQLPSDSDLPYARPVKSIGFYNGRPRPQIDLIDTLNFRTASVEEVRWWAINVASSGVATNSFFNFSFNPVPFEPDFKLTSVKSPKTKRVSFSPCTKVPPRQPKGRRNLAEIDLEHVVLFTLKDDKFTMFPQLIESPSLPLDSLPSLEESWEKLTILLWAAYLAENDVVILHTDDKDEQSVWQTNELVGRKLFLLHAALFELFPQEQMEQLSEEFRETLQKLLALSASLSPSGDEGMTPLAIASMACTPTSFNTFHNTESNISSLVIQKLITLDASMARKPVMSKFRGIKGQLPLHIILQSGKNWDEGVRIIYEAYPEGSDSSDARGRLPLHAAVASPSASGWAIHKMIQHAPQCIRILDHEGKLPLHHATEGGKRWSAGTESVFAAYPEAAFVPDFHGQLPSYYQFQEPEALHNGVGTNPASTSLLGIMMGDMSSKSLVNQGLSKQRKRPYNFFNFSSSVPSSMNKSAPVKSRGSMVARRQLALPPALHLTVLPELLELVSNPLQQ